MAPAVLLLVAGTLTVAVGAEWSVRGGVRVALGLGATPFLVGALLFGIDLESLGTVLTAVAGDRTTLAAGEAFGTIVFLFSAALGAALVLAPKPVESPGPWMVLLPAAALILGGVAVADARVSRLEGLSLLVAYAVYVREVVREGRRARERGRRLASQAERPSVLPPWMLTLAGVAFLSVGAFVLVAGGVRLLETTGLAAGFVGAAVIAALAGIDEVLLEVIPVIRGVPHLALGNLFGTLVAFSTAVPGLAAVIRPLAVDGAGSSSLAVAAVLYAVVGAAFLARGRAGRVVGLAVLGIYGGWLALAARA